MDALASDCRLHAFVTLCGTGWKRQGLMKPWRAVASLFLAQGLIEAATTGDLRAFWWKIRVANSDFIAASCRIFSFKVCEHYDLFRRMHHG